MSTSTLPELEKPKTNGSVEKPKESQTPNPTEKTPVEATNRTVEAEFRKKKLVRKNQGPSKIKYTIWLSGHIASIVFGVLSIVWQVLLLNNYYYINSILYRLSIVGAIVALVTTMTRRFGISHAPRFSMLLAQKNFQYFLLSFVWLFTFRSIFKILPTILISILQLAENKKIPVILKAGSSIGTVIAFNEIFLVLYLLVRTVFMLKTAGFQFLLMMMLLWLRVLFDVQTARIFAYVVDMLDGKVSTVKNKKLRKAWNKLRAFIKEKVEIQGPDK